MNWSYCVFLFCMLFCGYKSDLKAQEKMVNDDNQALYTNKISYLKVGLNYVSDAVFMGRRDTVEIPYFNPSILYQHKSGLFLSGSLSYLSNENAVNRVDLYLISGGYVFESEKLTTGITITSYLFDKESYNVKSSLTTDIGIYTGFLSKIADFYISGNLFMGDEVDFFAGVEINKNINLIKNKFYITPSFSVNAGSLQFYNSYYQTQRYGKRNGRISGNGTINSSVVINEVKKFEILDLELSGRLTYSFRNFEFGLVPIITIPKNEATILVNNQIEKEKLNTFLFWSAGISYQF